MKSVRTCDQCGAPLDYYAPEGVCPRCMLYGGLLGALGDASPASSSPATSEEGLFSPSWKLNLGRFGDYELLEEIAHGGMGVVYRARQISLNRSVAVKMLLLGQFSSEQSIQRFRREATAAASLQHPNVVAIHEVGAIDGQHFFSMDYVEGRSLAAIIRESPLSARAAVTYCRSIAEAIGYAHGRGIVHRDLKPSNVLIDIFDQVRITDFGLAKQLDGSSDLTVTGHLIGSPNYLPPELAAGKQKEASVVSDVYSIGAVLYECLTGRPPFLAESLQETLLKIRDTEVPAPRLLNSRIPRELETICLKCLEKSQANRYATAQGLADDLARFLNGEPIRARSVTRTERAWRWCQRKPAMASFVVTTGLLLLVVLIGSPVAAYRINQALKRAEAGELTARENQYASDTYRACEAIDGGDTSSALQLLNRNRPVFGVPVPAGTTSGSGVARPGRLKAGLATDLRGWEWRYLWQQCQGEQYFILGTHSNGVSAVGFLPDGKTAYSAGGDNLVRLWDLESRRQSNLLAHDYPITGVDCSPDGRWLATSTQSETTDEGALRVWNLENHQVMAVLTTNLWLRKNSIVFSPDSKLLAFVVEYEGVKLWDLEARQEIAHLFAYFQYMDPLGLTFSPDGQTLAYNENKAGDIALWDLRSRSVIKRLKGHARFVTSLAFTPDGKMLASGSMDKSVKLWDVAEGREQKTFTYTAGVRSLGMSPDGTLLAISGSIGGQRITVQEFASGRVVQQLRGHQKLIRDQAFSADGRKLITGSDDETVRVWDLTPAKDSGDVCSLTNLSTAWAGSGTAVGFSPNGEHLITVFADRTFSIWATRTLAESKHYPVPGATFACAALAPSGRLAAFVDVDGNVFFWSGETGESSWFARPTTNASTRALFSADGKRLAIGGSREVHVLDVSQQKSLGSFSLRDDEASGQGDLVMSLAFSRNGQKIAAGFYYGLVKVWDLTGPVTTELTLKGDGHQMDGLALLPDERTLVSASHAVRFWDLNSRQHSSILQETKAFWGCSVSPDGRRLAVGASDGLISIWDIESRQIVATLHGHEQPVLDVAFLPDGNTLVSVGDDRVRVWRAASSTEVDSTNHSR